MKSDGATLYTTWDAYVIRATADPFTFIAWFFFLDGLAFPVVYLLDGGGHFHHTVATVNLLARNGRMPRSIVVGITNTDRSRDFTGVARDGRSTGGADRFLDFLVAEVVPLERIHDAQRAIRASDTLGKVVVQVAG